LADEVVLDRMGRPGLKAPLALENYSGAGDLMLAIVEEEMDFLKNGNDDLMKISTSWIAVEGRLFL
jgi:hypothetical protein